MHGYDIFANVVVLAPPEKAKEIYDETAAFINRDTYVSAGITLTYARVFRKSLVTLPFILLIGVMNPVFDHRVAMTVWRSRMSADELPTSISAAAVSPSWPGYQRYDGMLNLFDSR